MFSKEEIKEIKAEIKSGKPYREIEKDWGIVSKTFLKKLNSGKYYYDAEDRYPLIIKGKANKDWIMPCIMDIVYSSDSLEEIAKRHNKSIKTIKKLNSGIANKNPKFTYPLNENRKCCIDYLQLDGEY